MKAISLLLKAMLCAAPLSLIAQGLMLDPTFHVASSMDGQWITTLEVDVNGKIVAGGLLSSYDGNARSSLMRLMPDGQIDPSFTPELLPTQVGLEALVSATSIQPDGNILVAGQFGLVNGEPRFGLARLLPNGDTDLSFSSILEGNFFAVGTAPNDNVFTGGAIFNANTGLYVMGPNGSILNTPVLNSSAVECIHTQPDGKVLVGFSGPPHLVRLEQDGSVDASFEVNMGSSTLAVYDIALLHDGRITIIGNFDTVDGVSRNNIARLMSNGSLDTTFDPGAGFNNRPLSLDTLPGGDLLVVSFSSTYDGINLNGASSGNLVRLNDAGDLDSSYVSDGMSEVLVQPDGKVLIGGMDLMHFGATYAHGMMRLAPDMSTFIGESRQPELRLWPNPAKEALHLQRGTDGAFAYTFTDVLGRKVGDGNGAGREGRIPLDRISTGTYLLCLTDERGMEIRQFVKE